MKGAMHSRGNVFHEFCGLVVLRAEALHFRSVEDATAMAFDGTMFLNKPLKIRLPKDYSGLEMSGPASFHLSTCRGLFRLMYPTRATKYWSVASIGQICTLTECR